MTKQEIAEIKLEKGCTGLCWYCNCKCFESDK
jgi:hypothetical protein